jgi:hypothetical protein
MLQKKKRKKIKKLKKVELMLSPQEEDTQVTNTYYKQEYQEICH